MKTSVFFLFVALLNTSTTSAQETGFITDSLDNYIERGLARWEIPGVAVCIVKDGEVLVSKGYGLLELGKSDKVDANTLFQIGSNTKAFTGTALALLDHEGKLSLQDKVQKWLPDFSMKDPWVTEHLNLTDIVTHRMGMETFQGDFMYWTSALTTDEVITKFGLLTPRYEFRTRYGYTNAGYAIAGEVIEAVTGKTWSEFVRERIFTPLEMERTVPLSTEFFDADNTAKPHTLINYKVSPVSFKNIDNLAPAGSIGSSVNDMSKWLIAQLDSGNYHGKNIIPFQVIQRTREPQSIVGRARHLFNKTHYRLYGLGWQLEDYEGREIVSHTGGVDGFVTSVTLVPEERTGIVVFTNTDRNLFFQSLKWEVLDALLGLPYRNYDEMFYERFTRDIKEEKELLQARTDTVNMKLHPIVELNEFTGSYTNEVYGSCEIILEDGQLIMSFEHHPDLKGILEPLGGSRFLCMYNDPVYGTEVISFHVENGTVESFPLRVNSFIEFTTYEFLKNL
jgi:CubicO group peptidase (beta-lactamase class C family)